MPRLDRRGGGRVIREAALTLLAVAVAARFVWALLTPVLPVLIGVLFLGGFLYFVVGRRH
jgi:hypothetical protein